MATEVEAGAELVLHVGDVSYANGDPDIWNTFMDYIEPYATRAPYMLGIGNHEYDWRTGGEKRHKHRRRPDASGRNKPYDPDWGNYGAPKSLCLLCTGIRTVSWLWVFSCRASCRAGTRIIIHAVQLVSLRFIQARVKLHYRAQYCS